MRLTDKYTQKMLDSFHEFGIDKFDLGVHRKDGTFVFRESSDIDREGITYRLKWLRYENMNGAEIYIRPARERSWRYVFLDDLNLKTAKKVARDYRTMLIHTSEAGGCHAWIETDKAITEDERLSIQQRLAWEFGADLQSVSGEHWGRLAGFRNYKRGSWVNYLKTSDAPFLRVSSISTPKGKQAGGCVLQKPSSSGRSIGACVDDSASGKEWGWVMGYLRSTGNAQRAIDQLAVRAEGRGKSDPRGYAEYTVSKAQKRLLHGENGLAG